MDFEIIQKYAKDYRVCPLEFEFDIALYSDFIICDYNYVFDPNVFLKRFFEDTTESYVFLIDEAHNLLERSRDMYSFTFKDSDFKDVLGKIPAKEDRRLKDKLIDILNDFKKLNQISKDSYYYFTDKYIDIMDDNLIKLSKVMEKFLVKREDKDYYEDILNLYFDIGHYLKISDYFTNGFYTVISYDKFTLERKFEIRCVDPGEVIKDKYKLSRSSILFSATLSPMKYFINMLRGEDSLKLRLDMPFDRKNLLILKSPISTRFKDRNKNLAYIAESIYHLVKLKKGNYFVFFPSYSYMQDVYEYYINVFDEEILLQERNMGEDLRKKFLENFNEDTNTVGFVVLGGVFSEGVDLLGDRLIGSIIVSVGMPKLSKDRDLIKYHFNKKGLNGFDYAYTYPGINKVFQAAGRVQRSENDKGIIYFIDDRYNFPKYMRLFPRHLKNAIEVSERKDLKRQVRKFWSIDEKKSD